MRNRSILRSSAILFAALVIVASSGPISAQITPAPRGGPGGTASRWNEVLPSGFDWRVEHAMAYDSARDRVVVFGGRSHVHGGQTLTPLWEFDGSNWIERTPATGPAWVDDHAMAYDSARGRVVLFGGHSFDPDVDVTGTWEWDGTTWVEHNPVPSPSTRSGHAMAYDSARGRVVLFGGITADTWEWDGSVWIERTPATSPPALGGHAMAYDSLRGRVVLFGGAEYVGPYEWEAHDSTWEWDGETWVEVDVETGVRPRARSGHAMVFDSARGTMVLFGGYVSADDPFEEGDYLNDTWELIGGTRWVRAVSGPDSRSGHAMVYDSLRRRVVLFGGYEHSKQDDVGHDRPPGADYFSDTWEYVRAPQPRGGSPGNMRR